MTKGSLLVNLQVDERSIQRMGEQIEIKIL